MFGFVVKPFHQAAWLVEVCVSFLGWLLFNFLAWLWGGLVGLLMLWITTHFQDSFGLGLYLALLTWVVLGLVGWLVTNGFGWVLGCLTPLRKSRRFVFWLDQVDGSMAWDLESLVTVDQVFFLPVVVVGSWLLDPTTGCLVVAGWVLLTMLGWTWFFRRHW